MSLSLAIFLHLIYLMNLPRPDKVRSRYLLSTSHFPVIDIYEQQACTGGVWNYTPASPTRNAHISIPQIDPHPPPSEPVWGEKDGRPFFSTPMYDDLESNIPHEMMAYRTDASLADNQLFPRHESILEYLQRYAEPVCHLVKFSTLVTSITRPTRKRWHLKATHLPTSHTLTATYDAIIVASGHYSVPYVPSIPGLAAWNRSYPERIDHSKYYRSPSSYNSQRTLLIGASASGLDIANQISPTCSPPLLLSHHSAPSSSTTTTTDSIRHLPPIAAFLLPSSGHKRAVRFSTGEIIDSIDRILFCTGYHYSYPFLSSLSPPLITTGERIHGLYEHIFWHPEPTLAFLGAPYKIIPFPTVEGQAAVIARVWSGRLSLPPQSHMQRWERERVAAKGGAERKFHEMPDLEDFDYLNSLVDWACQAEGEGMVPRKWDERDYWARKRFPAIKKAFVEIGKERRGIRSLEALGYDYERWKREQ